MPTVLRGNSGLGDAIYLRPVAEALKARGNDLVATTQYPEVFTGSSVPAIPFSKKTTDWRVSPGERKSKPTSQFEDMCIIAGLGEKISQRIPWVRQNQRLVDEVTHKADGRPVMLVKSSYMPFGRRDTFGKDMMPRYEVMDDFLGRHREFFRVLIGGEIAQQRKFANIDLSLFGRTTVCDLFDLAGIAACAVSQVGFTVPLMESQGQRVMAFFSRSGLNSKEDYLRKITPNKILNLPTSAHVVDDMPMTEIESRFAALMAGKPGARVA